MSKSTTVKTVDLNVAHTAGDPAVVQIHAHEFYVSQVGPGDHDATIHLDGPNGDGEPAEPGPFTADDGQPFSTIYVVNEAAGEASELQIVTRDGYCRRQEPTYRTVPAAASTGFDPERLSGALAATTTIADAAEASEEVDTAGAKTLRVRARVSGTGRLDELSRTADADVETPRAVAVDQAGNRLWVGGTDPDVNTLIEVDITDQNNPARVGAVTDALLDDVRSLEYDATNDLLIAARDTGTSQDLVVIDTSTPGTPSVSGSVGITSERPAYLDLHEAEQLAAVAGDPGIVADSDVDLVDYSTAATPSVESTLGLTRCNGVAFDPDRGLLYVNDAGADEIQAWTVADPTSPAKIATEALPGTIWDSLAYDRARQHIFVGQQNDTDNLRVYDVTDRGEIRLRAEVTIPTSGGQVFHTEYAVFRSPENILITGTGRSLIFVDAEDLDAPKLVDRVIDVGARFDAHAEVWKGPSDELVTWTLEFGNAEYVSYATTFGADELRIYVTNPGSSRSTTKTPATVTLEDGREGAVDMELAGEDTIEIEIAGRSGVQTTVDYVDVYRAT